VGAAALPDALYDFARRYRTLLTTADVALRTRPRPGVWSPLEYACHVRDVLFVQRERLIAALVEHAPAVTPMQRDERVALAHYAEEPTAEVVAGIEIAALLFARVFRDLTPEQLSRPCVYNFPEPATRDVGWIGAHTLHELQHHLVDMGTSLSTAGGG
jgi:S-DNA-T family DNA segregation ATPase FtsK/SpoIIIE